MKKLYFKVFVMTFIFNINLCYAFKQGIHQYNITEPALLLDGFDADTANDVGDANWWTDIYEPKVLAAHADDNQLAAASGRLDRKIDFIISDLQSCERWRALENLGQALHTVQDIYSHSNAVDNGIAIPDILSMSNGTAWCDSTNSVYAPDGLVSGYFSFEGFLFGLNNINPENGPVTGDDGSCEGAPKHGIPGIIRGQCCHRDLNKDNASQVNGENTWAAQNAAYSATRNYLNLIYARLIKEYPENSNYYTNMLKEKQKKTIYVIDTTGSMEDDLDELKQTINSDLDDIIKSDKAPTLGLVTFKDEDEIISNELRCEIPDFRSQINAIEALGGDDCPEASAEAVGDAIDLFPSSIALNGSVLPGGDIILHTDAPPSSPNLLGFLEFRANNKGIRVNSTITPGCEEIVSHNAESRIFTKAINQNNHQKNRIRTSNSFVKGSAKDIYQKLADKTGGVSFQVNKDEINQVMPISLYLTEPDTETIFSNNVLVNSNATVELTIKIDSSMSSTNAMFMVKTTDESVLPMVQLIKPDGSIVSEFDTHINLISLNSLIVYKVDFPVSGEWKLRLSNGNSKYLIKAFGKTDFRVSRVSLLKSTEIINIRGEDLIPVTEHPVYGEEIVILVHLTAAPEYVGLDLISEDESILLSPNLTLVDGSTSTYQTRIVVPNESFKIKITGLINKSQFQREIALRVKPTTVKLEFDGMLGLSNFQLNGIQSEPISFNINVTNKSSNFANYSLNANSQNDFQIIMQSNIAIPSGETVQVPVVVNITPNAIVGSIDEIMIIAQDVNDENNSNYKVARLVVKSDLLFADGFE